MIKLNEGVWSVMLTSFNDDKSIDFDGVKSLIDFYIDNGCSGMFAACSSSEVLMLDNDEILRLCRHIVKYTNGRVQVVGGAICHKPLKLQAELINMMLDTGIDLPVITTNQFCRQEDDSRLWKDNLRRLLDMTDCQLGIYESPFPYKRLLSLEEMDFVCRCGRFSFLKDTCCDAETIRKKLKIAKLSGLSFYNANVNTLVSSLNDGGQGYCGTASNFYPDIIKFIFENFNDQKLIQDAENFMLAGEEVFKYTYPLAGKFFLKQRGVNMKLNCRIDAEPLSSGDKNNLLNLLEDMKEISSFNEADVSCIC